MLRLRTGSATTPPVRGFICASVAFYRARSEFNKGAGNVNDVLRNTQVPWGYATFFTDAPSLFNADRSENFINGLIGPCMKFFSCFVLQRMRNVNRRGVEADRCPL